MTRLEQAAKTQIIDVLRSQGYATYARLLDLFDIQLTEKPDVVGYMLPGKAKIVLNSNLSIDQVSTLVRHEILHEYLSHGPRGEDFEKQHSNYLPNSKLSNIAADYEISNRGYTDKDKSIARAIKLGDQVLRGLVTEDEYPDWENKTFEEMYEELLKEQDKYIKMLQPLIDQLSKMNQRLPEDMDDMSDTSSQSQQISQNAQQISQGASSKSQEAQQKGNPEQAQDAKGLSDEAKDLSDKAQQLADKAKETGSEIQKTIKDKNDGEVFDSTNEQQEKERLASNVIKIRKAFNDLKEKEELLDETSKIINKEKIAKKAKDLDRFNHDPTTKFRTSLNRFIKNQIETGKGVSWGHINKTYVNTGLIKPGRTRLAKHNIPLINVYFDVSGSFSDPKKTAGARQSIATLNKYVRSGDIKINVYYFADQVAEIATEAGGGTSGQPILDHIEATKPSNVIIITDDDISDCSTNCVVPGAVWLLFYDAQSQNLINHIKGKSQTQIFNIEY